jgi:hypothetical protein
VTTRHLDETPGALIAMLTQAQDAEAVKSAVVTIRNPTGVTIPYRLKWGVTGEWRPVRLAPQSEVHHSFALADGQTPPRPYIEFDRTGGTSGYRAWAHRLECEVQQSQTGGRAYTFRFAPGGRILHLCRSY